MKNFIIISFVFIFSACGINKQANQIKALEKCKYEIVSADSLYLGGTDITKLINAKDREISLSNLPSLALGFLRKDIPINGRINLRINNPSTDLAAINQFQYLVLIKGTEIANGFVNQKISVAPGESVVIPVNLKSNLYPFLSDDKTMQDILEFVNGDPAKGREKKSMVTLKIKPTISVGNKLLNYPGFITIDKEVSSKILF